jgi:hypothetical protein
MLAASRKMTVEIDSWIRPDWLKVSPGGADETAPSLLGKTADAVKPRRQPGTAAMS